LVVVRLLGPTDPDEDYLAITVQAASLSYLYHQRPSLSTLQTARKSYNHALRDLQKALLNPKTASRHATLLTVLLLDMFESMTKDDETEMRHLNGAIALVKLRGEKQFKDPVGLCMFLHLNSNVLSSCLRRGVEVPEEFIAIRKLVGRLMHPDDLEWQLSELVVQFAALRADLKRGVPRNKKVEEQVRVLDREFKGLFAAVSSIPKVPLGARLDPKGRNYFQLVQELLDDTIRQTEVEVPNNTAKGVEVQSSNLVLDRNFQFQPMRVGMNHIYFRTPWNMKLKKQKANNWGWGSS